MNEEVNGIQPAGYCEATNSSDEYDYFFNMLEEPEDDINIFLS